MTDLARGAIVLFGERGEFTGKPRPGVIVQRGSTLADSPSITLCGLTSTPIPGNPLRIAVPPTAANGLRELSFVMIDKLASISRSRIRDVIGALEQDEMAAVDTALRRWLDL
jgi:mRNA interferase MazF